jgi:adenosylcobinamide kinase / adenosylcobinamide-phosphate guanylyltransferase
MALTFITGGVRSGKSRFARLLAERHDGPVTYVATARGDVEDAEFADRIRRHRAERPAHWATIETAGATEIDLAAELARHDARELLLIDSLGTWLAADMREGVTLDDLLARSTALLDALRACPCAVIVVSEETGWGIVPEHPSGRLFRDALGLVNQQLAREADAAHLVVSGYALDLKTGIPVE